MGSKTPVAVRQATEDDISTLADVLHQAFDDDPIVGWMLPDHERRASAAPRGFALWLRRLYLPKGHVYTDTDTTAAALWAPPGKWRTPAGSQARLLPQMARIFSVRRLPLILKGLTLLDERHPDTEPHWYLGLLGTHPQHQGHGIGSAVMSVVLDRCDDEGLPAYLESSKERNVPYYHRHGFEVIDEFDLPEGPPVWTMWREPRTRSGG